MNKWINSEFEKNIKLWQKKVITNREDTLYLELKNDNDFFVLQNFFLICQIMNEKKLNLHIRTLSNAQEAFRIKHYLYACRNLANKIYINGNLLREREVNFFKVLPLISIDEENYIFLSTRICDIEKKLNNEIGKIMLKKLKENYYEKLLTIEQRCLLRLSLNGLYGGMDGFKDFGEYRADYFERQAFKDQVKNVPFLAFLLFAVYDRVNHEELANVYKEEKKEREKKIKVIMKITEMPEAIPSDQEVVADIFNAWDLSDGILQLLENIVEHAGTDTQLTNERKRKGKGMLSIRIHSNSKNPTYLKNTYDQYFKGYENRYNERFEKYENGKRVDRTEKQYFGDCHLELKRQVNKMRYIQESSLKNYEIIRNEIEKRRNNRKNIKHFLDIQISDISGKNMCNVFRENLKAQEYKEIGDFECIKVRSFFDSCYIEKEKFQKYYQRKNIVNHYGIQIFMSVVLNNDGYFRVRSHSANNYLNMVYDTTKDDYTNLNDLLEGTRYQILLPFRRQTVQESNSMVNVDIIYHEKLLEEKEILNNSDESIRNFYKIIEEYSESKYTKEEAISILSSCLKLSEKNKNRIIVFDMKYIPSDKIEVFCKAIILYIASGNNDNYENNIAVVNCSTQDFVSIVRIFSVCYDKNGECDWMGKTQVYLCGIDMRQEFLISGNNIHTLLTRVEKLAFSRKIHPMCIQILRKILEKKRKSDYQYLKKNEKDEDFNYIPFDLLLEIDGKTIFENNVKTVLENNIQSIESGCMIDMTHMRLGSKIHIDVFYEAELLFYNNYYTSRFASLLYKNLINILKEKEEILGKKPICLIGYETYSEMLLCELRDILNNKDEEKCNYVVYEIKTDGDINLRYKESVEKGMIGVLIVPIITTLTTFNKVRAEVNNQLSELPILAYMGVIQVLDSSKAVTVDGRTEIEKMYWDEIKFKEHRIYSRKLLGEKEFAHYLVEVKCRWAHPLKCNQCFPRECLVELPLVEANKISVVPTQLIGLREEVEDSENKPIKRVECAGKVESLRGYFYHGHIIRNDNHFCYYIRTAAYYQAYKKDIHEWLNKVRDSLLKKTENEGVVFNIIVTPMHFSNTGFVEAVNEVIFKGASYVLRIESEKEFRDNIQTKYSDLTTLYWNFLKTGNQAVINFYFVDDNIITGRSYYRIRHLVNSLFCNRSSSIVNVNIFRSVIVLLNRQSSFSMTNYVENIEDYYAYIDLNISNLRSFEDACFLCKTEIDCQKLADYSSTNAINKYWVNKKEKYILKSLPEIKKEFIEKQMNKTGKIKIERLYKRMIATHNINKRLSELKAAKNDSAEVYKMLVQEIGKIEASKRNEFMTAYIYAIAYPFVVYRKSCREAAFHMIVILFELFVYDFTLDDLQRRIEIARNLNEISVQTSNNLMSMVKASIKLVDTLKKVKDKPEFLKFLIKVSVELRCNYIIRSDRMDQVLQIYYKYVSSDKRKDEKLLQFKIYFTSMVKKLLDLSSDSSKSTHFEELIYEKINNMDFKENNDAFQKYLFQTYLSLYLENTGGYFSAIKDLQKNGICLNEYYLENYTEILKIDGVKKIKDQEDISKNYILVYQHLNMKDQGRVISEENLSGDFHKNIEYYSQLAEYIKVLTEARRVQFLFSHSEKVLKIDNNNNVVFDKDILKYDVFSCDQQEENMDLILKDEQIEEMHNNLIMDTLSYEGNYAIVIYKRNSGKNGNQDYQDDLYFKPIYLLLEYDSEIQIEQLSKIRRVLVFRNMMIQRFEKDFGNNVMQNWIEQSRIIKQLEKARAFVHTKDSDVDDMTNVWNICKGFFYGLPDNIKKHKEQYGDIQEGCILELMTDIRIGRINLLLLSNSEFQIDSNDSKHSFRIAEEYLETLQKAYYWKNVLICDENWKHLEGCVIEDKIYDSILKENRNGKYNRVNEYLSYLIAETIHSASLYGVKEKKDGKVKISIYKEKEYLYICNKIDRNQDEQKKRIEGGLERRGNGISLAVICEYFIKQYLDRYVKIEIKNRVFRIGLPIFE